MNFIFLAAFSPELDPIRERVGNRPAVTCAEVGVGAVKAAAETSRLLAEGVGGEKRGIVFVGSLGSVDKEVEILSPVVATGVISADEGTCSEKGFLPEGQVRSYKADESLVQLVTNALSEDVIKESIYTPPSITRETSLGELYRKHTGARFENLELFGIAAAAAAHKVPWTALSLVTNHVGPEGHDQWLTSHTQAAEKTAQFVETIISI